MEMGIDTYTRMHSNVAYTDTCMHTHAHMQLLRGWYSIEVIEHGATADQRSALGTASAVWI